LRCRSCGADYALAQLSRIIDEGMEEVLADVPCDRL
jgi:hypothetical protein